MFSTDNIGMGLPEGASRTGDHAHTHTRALDRVADHRHILGAADRDAQGFAQALAGQVPHRVACIGNGIAHAFRRRLVGKAHQHEIRLARHERNAAIAQTLQSRDEIRAHARIRLARSAHKILVSQRGQSPGLRGEDLFVNIVDSPKENWSVGHGLAQFA